MQADYSTVMPFIVKALLDNRARYEKMSGEGQEIPAGYLRSRDGYRLFDQREKLCRRLKNDVHENREWLLKSMLY
jgi:deoxyhypusine synthase